jgi:flavin-binding protein dodecin
LGLFYSIQKIDSGEILMADNVYKKIELTGSSSTSIEDAIQNAVAKAAQTVRNMRWFEVTETRGNIKDGQVDQWQVTLKIGFKLED